MSCFEISICDVRVISQIQFLWNVNWKHTKNKIIFTIEHFLKPPRFECIIYEYELFKSLHFLRAGFILQYFCRLDWTEFKKQNIWTKMFKAWRSIYYLFIYLLNLSGKEKIHHEMKSHFKKQFNHSHIILFYVGITRKVHFDHFTLGCVCLLLFVFIDIRQI